MCKSVPQMEAVFTRTSTSVGPIKGTATVSICRPFAARTFRSAFIVATIYSDSRPSRGRSFDQFVLIRPVSVCPRLACANFHASISAPRETFITRPPNYFCYSLFVALTSVKSYVHFAQPHGAAYPPQPHRCHLRRCASFPSCRFSPFLAGLGLHGYLVLPHAGYFGLFSEARSPTRRAPLAHKRKNQRTTNHHSRGTMDCLCVIGDSGIRLPFRLVARSTVANDSFPTLRLHRLSHHPLGHEREQFRLTHRTNRRGAASHLHRTVRARPPSHVFWRCSHVVLPDSGAWLLVGAAGLSPRHPFIVLRLLKEEKMLCRDLPGYSDYCLRTRYRLLPLLW